MNEGILEDCTAYEFWGGGGGGTLRGGAFRGEFRGALLTGGGGSAASVLFFVCFACSDLDGVEYCSGFLSG